MTLTEFFEKLIAKHSVKLSLTWLTSELFGILNKLGLSLEESPVDVEMLSELISLIENNTISGKIAKEVLDIMIETNKNAKQIVESFPKDQKIIFGPDRNLGGYINSITGRNMVLWNGGCHVHARFTVKNIERLKNKYPDALVLTHPECDKSVVEISDYVGSTAGILKFATNSDKKYQRGIIKGNIRGILGECVSFIHWSPNLLV